MAEPTRTRLQLLHDLHNFFNGFGTYTPCECPMCSLRTDVTLHLHQEQMAEAALKRMVPLEHILPSENVDPMEDTQVEMPARSAQDSKIRQEARQFYEVYCQSSDWKNFRGDPCPQWEDLPEAIQGHWCAVVRHARKAKQP